MNKKILILSSVLFTAAILMFSPISAFSWGQATHAYIADNIGRKGGADNLNEIYGAIAPDLFNYAFSLPLPDQLILRDLTHGFPGNEAFMDVWSDAATQEEKALAYGFLSHNDVWAADFTAHWDSRTLREAKEYDEGYVITKSKELESEILHLSDLGIPEDVALTLSHVLLETVGDVLIKRYDPNIGQKLMSACTSRPPGFASYLDSVYGFSGMLGPGVIEAVENEYNTRMHGYGWILNQSPEDTRVIPLLAATMRDLAVEYGIPSDILPDVETIVEMFVATINFIEKDYMREVRATKGFVNSQLNKRAIRY